MATKIPTKVYIAHAGHDYDGNVRIETALAQCGPSHIKDRLRITDIPNNWARMSLPELHQQYEGQALPTVLIGAFNGFTFSLGLLPKLRQTVIAASIAHYQAETQKAQAIINALKA